MIRFGCRMGASKEMELEKDKVGEMRRTSATEASKLGRND
jgi:hypothetical protein